MAFSKHLTFTISKSNEEFKINLPTNIDTDKITLNISNDSRYKLFIKFNNQTFYTVNALTDISYNVPLVFGYEFTIETELQIAESTIARDTVNINISTVTEALNLNYMALETYNYMTEQTYIYTRTFSSNRTYNIIQNGYLNGYRIKRIKYLYASIAGTGSISGYTEYTIDGEQIRISVSGQGTNDYFEIGSQFNVNNLQITLSGNHSNDKTIIVYS